MSPAENEIVLGRGDDASFQPERTGLAWNRTLVVLAVAFGILGVHAYRDGLHIAVMAICALLAAVLLVVSSPVARRRASRASGLMAGRNTSLPRLPLLLMSAVTTVLALASLFLILIRG